MNVILINPEITSATVSPTLIDPAVPAVSSSTGIELVTNN